LHADGPRPPHAFPKELTSSIGAVTLGANWARSITRTRAFTIGVPMGAVGGLAMSPAAADLPASALVPIPE
jgi:hypothetical protein